MKQRTPFMIGALVALTTGTGVAHAVDMTKPQWKLENGSVAYVTLLSCPTVGSAKSTSQVEFLYRSGRVLTRLTTVSGQLPNALVAYDVRLEPEGSDVSQQVDVATTRDRSQKDAALEFAKFNSDLCAAYAANPQTYLAGVAANRSRLGIR